MHIATSYLSRSLGSTRDSSWFCPLGVLLRDPIGIILPAVWSVMGGVYTPMFLTERTVLLCPASLWNPVTKGDHLPLRQVARPGCILRSFSNLLSQVGLLDTFKDFKKFPGTLWYQGSTELILVLPVPRNHSEDVACLVSIIKWPTYLH